MEKTIGINTVLDEMEQSLKGNVPTFFSLTYVKSGSGENDKERGKLLHIKKASKRGNATKKAGSRDKKKNRTVTRFKETGKIPIHDHDKDRQIDLFIDLIIFFNGIRVVR